MNKPLGQQQQELYASLLKGAIKGRGGDIPADEMERIAEWLDTLVKKFIAATAVREGLVTMFFDEGADEPGFGVAEEDHDELMAKQEEQARALN